MPTMSMSEHRLDSVDSYTWQSQPKPREFIKKLSIQSMSAAPGSSPESHVATPARSSIHPNRLRASSPRVEIKGIFLDPFEYFFLFLLLSLSRQVRNR